MPMMTRFKLLLSHFLTEANSIALLGGVNNLGKHSNICLYLRIYRVILLLRVSVKQG